VVGTTSERTLRFFRPLRDRGNPDKLPVAKMPNGKICIPDRNTDLSYHIEHGDAVRVVVTQEFDSFAIVQPIEIVDRVIRGVIR